MKINKKSSSGKPSCQTSSSHSTGGCGCSQKGSAYEEELDVEISE